MLVQVTIIIVLNPANIFRNLQMILGIIRKKKILKMQSVHLTDMFGRRNYEEYANVRLQVFIVISSNTYSVFQRSSEK
jgi:hypothetical protein